MPYLPQTAQTLTLHWYLPLILAMNWTKKPTLTVGETEEAGVTVTCLFHRLTEKMIATVTPLPELHKSLSLLIVIQIFHRLQNIQMVCLVIVVGALIPWALPNEIPGIITILTWLAVIMICL
ncbi:hypothetical protein PPACK8108_LOCUS22869 [Phakopsora pachyrhizi]|uniref:Uncharacterized protein n=1 Tax=Phakopsora pachyrhizi TaxID=170000 RepID=A0AAV0BPN6_PHAPC|nr:hypothetical protein PPACK8108_LOCUS22869 [Phakopsora pachyrhizi]